jgi:hypothetical protein
VQTMAASSIVTMEWHSNLSISPKITGETVDKFVLQQSVA